MLGIDSYSLDNYVIDGSNYKPGLKFYNASVWHTGGTVSNIPFKPLAVIMYINDVSSDSQGGSTVNVRTSGTIGAYLKEDGTVNIMSGPIGTGYYGTSRAFMQNVVFSESSITFTIGYLGSPSISGNLNCIILG
jgi:hypothetical protein